MPARRDQEPFIWHGAAPRTSGLRGFLAAALCVVCASAGYYAGRSAVDPGQKATPTQTQEMVSLNGDELGRPAQSTNTAPEDSSVQPKAPAADVPRVVLLNPNATENVRDVEGEHNLHAIGQAAVSQPVPKRAAAAPFRKKPKAPLSRGRQRSVAGADNALRGPFPARAPRNTLASKQDSEYRDYRDLRAFMLR
jgi:hypothetical protein